MKRVFSMILLLVFATPAAAYSTYTIGGLFSAVFPGAPSFTGELGAGKEKSRGYAYTDEENYIFFSATYQVNKNHYRKNEVGKQLRNFVNGQKAIGRVTSFRYKKIKGCEGVTFSLDVPYQGEIIRKFSVVCYKDGRFLSWSVQEIVNFSKLSAKFLFDKYLPRFSLT